MAKIRIEYCPECGKETKHFVSKNMFAAGIESSKCKECDKPCKLKIRY